MPITEAQSPNLTKFETVWVENTSQFFELSQDSEGKLYIRTFTPQKDIQYTPETIPWQLEEVNEPRDFFAYQENLGWTRYQIIPDTQKSGWKLTRTYQKEHSVQRQFRTKLGWQWEPIPENDAFENVPKEEPTYKNIEACLVDSWENKSDIHTLIDDLFPNAKPSSDKNPSNEDPKDRKDPIDLSVIYARLQLPAGQQTLTLPHNIAALLFPVISHEWAPLKEKCDSEAEYKTALLCVLSGEDTSGIKALSLETQNNILAFRWLLCNYGGLLAKNEREGVTVGMIKAFFDALLLRELMRHGHDLQDVVPVQLTTEVLQKKLKDFSEQDKYQQFGGSLTAEESFLMRYMVLLVKVVLRAKYFMLSEEEVREAIKEEAFLNNPNHRTMFLRLYHAISDERLAHIQNYVVLMTDQIPFEPGNNAEQLWAVLRFLGREPAIDSNPRFNTQRFVRMAQDLSSDDAQVPEILGLMLIYAPETHLTQVYDLPAVEQVVQNHPFDVLQLLPVFHSTIQDKLLARDDIQAYLKICHLRNLIGIFSGISSKALFALPIVQARLIALIPKAEASDFGCLFNNLHLESQDIFLKWDVVQRYLDNQSLVSFAGIFSEIKTKEAQQKLLAFPIVEARLTALIPKADASDFGSLFNDLHPENQDAFLQLGAVQRYLSSRWLVSFVSIFDSIKTKEARQKLFASSVVQAQFREVIPNASAYDFGFLFNNLHSENQDAFLRLGAVQTYLGNQSLASFAGIFDSIKTKEAQQKLLASLVVEDRLTALIPNASAYDFSCPFNDLCPENQDAFLQLGAVKRYLGNRLLRDFSNIFLQINTKEARQKLLASSAVQTRLKQLIPNAKLADVRSFIQLLSPGTKNIFLKTPYVQSYLRAHALLKKKRYGVLATEIVGAILLGVTLGAGIGGLPLLAASIAIIVTGLVLLMAAQIYHRHSIGLLAKETPKAESVSCVV